MIRFPQLVTTCPATADGCRLIRFGDYPQLLTRVPLVAAQ